MIGARASVTAALREQLEAVGDGITKLPSERSLAAELGVSRQTTRHALQDLQRAGVITAAIGKGYYRTAGTEHDEGARSHV